MDMAEFQSILNATYGERDATRPISETIAWLTEEVGELAQAVRKGTRDQQMHELSDVIAWVTSLADQLGLSLDEAASRFAKGCPICGKIPCSCP